MKEELDIFDKKILFELDIDSRISASKIAKKLKLPKETVNYRIKRLEKNGWINRFYTIVNASLFGYSYYQVLLKFDKINSSVETKIVDYITSNPTCANLRILEGHYDLVFLTIQKNPGELKAFLQCFFNNYSKYIQEKNVLIVMKTYKLNQKFLFEGKTIKRTFNHVEIKDQTLDKIDLGIINAISINARIKLSEIASKLKLDSRLIDYHIKRMERLGLIVAYTTDLNLVKLNMELIKVDIALKDPTLIPRIIDFFDKTNTCIFIYELLGTYDLSVELYVKNDEMVSYIFKKFKEKFLESYVYYDLAHVYKKYVINWSPFHV